MLVTGLLAINKQDWLGTHFVFVMRIIFPPTNWSVVTEHSPLPCSPRKLLEFVGVRVLFLWVSWDFKNRRGGARTNRNKDGWQRTTYFVPPHPPSHLTLSKIRDDCSFRHENHQCAINNYPEIDDEWSINIFFQYLSLLLSVLDAPHFMWTIRCLWHQSLK